MLSLMLIVLIVLSIVKPDLMISKKLKELASDEQYEELVKYTRISNVFTLSMAEIALITPYYLEDSWLTIALYTVLLVLFFAFGLKKIKRAAQLRKEILNTAEE